MQQRRVTPRRRDGHRHARRRAARRPARRPVARATHGNEPSRVRARRQDLVARPRRAPRSTTFPGPLSATAPADRSTPSRRARATSSGDVVRRGPAPVSPTSASPASPPGASLMSAVTDAAAAAASSQARRSGDAPPAWRRRSPPPGRRSAPAPPRRWEPAPARPRGRVHRRPPRRVGRDRAHGSAASASGGDTTSGAMGRDGDRHRTPQRIGDAGGHALQVVARDRAGDERQRRGPGSGRIRSPVRHRLMARVKRSGALHARGARGPGPSPPPGS